MNNQYLFIGGPANRTYITVENPGLTQTQQGHQYIIQNINGTDIYASVELCYREAKAAAKNHWKHTPATPTPQPVFTPNIEEETTQSVVTSDANQEDNNTQTWPQNSN